MSILLAYSKSIWLSLAFCLVLTGFGNSLAVAQKIQWHQDIEQAKAEALKTNRMVWLHFSADWCLPCKKLDTFVFNDTSVIRAIDRNTVAVNIDVDENDSLVKKFDVPRIPYDVVMTPSGEVIINRRSPSRSTDFLNMFDRLDGPLQTLNSGDRELINARIGTVQRVMQKTIGKQQDADGLDLGVPSHDMAPTTVQGQRLERGFESSKRAAEIRAIEASLLKQKAELFIAAEKQKENVGQRPKLSINPFYNASPSDAKPAVKHNPFVKNTDISLSTQQNSFPLPEQKYPVRSGNALSVVSNQFVGKQEEIDRPETDSDFLPPLPPTFAKMTPDKVENEFQKNVTAYEERQKYGFPELTPGKVDDVAANDDVQFDEKLSTLKPSGQTVLLPKLSKFSEKPENNDFVGTPVNNLEKTIDSVAKADVVPEMPTKFGLSGEKLLPIASNPPVPKQRLHTKKRADSFSQSLPEMKTAISIPRAPVMVEGVVKIDEKTIPAVEGQLLAVDQNPNNYNSNRSRFDQLSVPRKAFQNDEILEKVDFFGSKKPPQFVRQAVVTPVQPQIVINLNTEPSPTGQPAQAKNQARIIQPSAVKQATASTPATGLERIKNADTVSTEKTKLSLKGKCPVTLLTEGRWVDGKKQYGCVHRDRVYLFASAAHRGTFLANPDQMSPLLAGFDPVIFEETGKLIQGEEKFGTFMGEVPNRRIVLFKTADTRARFQNEPVKYLNVIRNAMTKNATKDTKLR